MPPARSARFVGIAPAIAPTGRDAQAIWRSASPHGQPSDADRDPHRRRRHHRPRRRHARAQGPPARRRRWATSTSSIRSLGVLLAEPLPDDVRELLVVIQHELFNLGGELSIPGLRAAEGRGGGAPRRGAGAPQRRAAAPGGVHPAGRHAQRGARACRPHGRAARRARGGRAGAAETGQRRAAPVPEPPSATCCSCWRGC